MLMFAGILIGGGVSVYGSIKASKALKAKKKAAKKLTESIETIESTEDDSKLPAINDVHIKAKDSDKKNLSIASAALGLVLAGSFFSPLSVVGVGGLIYLILPTWKQAYHDITIRKRFTRMVLESFALPITLLSGHVIAVAVAYWILYFAVYNVSKAKDNTSKNLANVFVAPSHQIVYVLRDGAEIEMTMEDIQIGDTLVIGAGEIIPVDGEIISGHASIDQHMLTGESQPIEKQQGDEVFSSTLLLSGNIHIKVEKAGIDTIANQTHQILSEMTSFTDNLELRGTNTADRMALPYFLAGTATTAMKGAGAGLAIIWSPLDDALYAAGPLTVLNYLNIGLQRGVLIKDGRALETLRKVTTIVFDKTGTLTNDVPSVIRTHACGEADETEVLRYAAAAEQKQIHPVALAILAAAAEQNLDLPKVKGSSYNTGFGLSVMLGEQSIQVGSFRFMKQLSLALPESLEAVEKESHDLGYSLIYVAVDNEIIGAVELHATVRGDTVETIDKLHEMGYKVCIISGDNEKPTRHLAKQLGIDKYFAETLPQDKANLIQSMQEDGEVICYMGDGINDTIALKQAEVSVSLSGASTIATDTAQIILMNEELGQIIDLIELSKGLQKTYKNTILSSAIPTAGVFGGVLFFHVGLTAAIAAYMGGMSMSMGHAMYPLLKEKMNKSRNKNKPEELEKKDIVL